MSELEYEKSGRGSRGPSNPLVAVPYEFAWGDTTYTDVTTLTNSGQASERGQAGSNINFNYTGGIAGPVRVGSFSMGVDTRAASGASFYGVMELSGNVWERAVSVGNSSGRAFQGRYHGDGVLDTAGDSNTTNWPTTNAVGASVRGGDWFREPSKAQLSDRSFVGFSFQSRDYGYGGRGVRSAP